MEIRENQSLPESSDVSADVSDETLLARVQEVVEQQINPALAMHGGFLTLVELKERRLYVEMGGGCQGCAASSMTLRAGIETMILEEIPEIIEVLDATDHSAGSNPYFQ